MIESLYPCFKRWSEKGSVYLVSDTHFKDLDREYMGYYINSMDQAYIISQVCHKNDTLIHLGDVGEPAYMNMIKTHKVLIMGNHDQSIEKMSKYFDEVYSGPLWISQKLVLSHEPIVVEDENGVPVAINIHGHDHSGEAWDYYHVNIVPNKYGYSPLNLKDFIKEGYLKRAIDIHSITKEVAAERKNNKQWSMFSV